ncbi:hypothetical protein BDV93DRAFT_134715 [Ceratobasidium sp. AG-I]|nr:hypothetical protein BDV93DRAFT_134715 [Ceratobasidium sp. AG-I]
MDSIRGLPLLSGPPPQAGDAESCRKCNKEFNRIFNRPKQCNHCAYQYCSTCCNHGALMPRIGVYNGFDPVDVCSYCIEVLRVTAMGRTQLRAMPLSHLKAYIKAYGLAAPSHAVEKDDYVRTIMDARERNGCLSRVNEDFYRRNSIPPPSGDRPRGFLSRMADGLADLADLLPQPDNQPPPPPVPPRPANPQVPPRNREPRTAPAPPPRPQTNTGHHRPPPGSSRQQAPPRNPVRPTNPPAPNVAPRTAPHSQPPPPSSQRPTPQAIPIEQLLEMQSQDISKLSVGVLKAILQQNHVRIPQDALEKRDIIERVVTLVEAARAEKEHDARARAAEAEAEMEEQRRALEEIERKRNAAPKPEAPEEKPHDEENEPHSELPQAARPAAAKLERDGLCVICQDEDANIAIVDCGHLCLCMECSELIMSSSKECPLCRTRIVTSQRLLRIFRT